MKRTTLMEAMLPLPQPRVQNWFKLVAHKLDGTSRDLTGWFPNLIHDVGLERMGIGSFRDRCWVGTGSSAPTVTDTQLNARVAISSTTEYVPSVPGSSTSPTTPHWAQTNAGYRFSVGSAAGNLTEVGVGWTLSPYNTVNDYQLWSRALILDETLTPTAVTVLADEVLDVYYSMRIYPPAADATYQVTIGGELYDCITRASNVTSTLNWFVPNGRVQFMAPGGNPHTVYNGNIGAVTASPSGLSNGFTGSLTNLAYSSGSLVQDATHSWGLNDGNITGGIRSILYFTNVGTYQTQFTLVTPRGDGSTTINKDATKVLSLGFRVGWARRP